MIVQKNKWNLPSLQDGSSFIVRTHAAEKDLCEALDLLNHVKESVPHTPASETKSQIEDFLYRFKKKA